MNNHEKYRQWKEMTRGCDLAAKSDSVVGKAGSRGTRATICKATGKKCRMSGCARHFVQEQCGHPLWAIVSSDEETHYCEMCENESD